MKSVKGKFILTTLLIFIFTIALYVFASFFYGKSSGEIIRNGIFSVFFSMGLCYIYYCSFKLEKLNYDNNTHPFRLLIVYFIGLILTLVFPFIDKKGWFFLSIAVALLVFSNTIISVFSVSGFIFMALLLCKDPDLVTVFVYLFTSLIGIMLFVEIDKGFHVAPAILISTLTLFVFEVAGFVFLENEELSAEQFVMPIVNVAINSITMYFFLKYFNVKILNRFRNRFLEINDQEYKALVELKAVSIDEYFRSIHTAYLTERMANAIGCDVDVAKNVAYYHRIKKVFSYSEADCKRFVEENDFPPKASKQLLDFLNKDAKLITKEAGIVYISDKFISTVMSVFSKDKNAKINYEELVETMFEKSFFVEALEDSDLSRKDFRLIKDIILKETLYYDFLR